MSIRQVLTELAGWELMEGAYRRMTNERGNPELVWDIAERGLRDVD